MWVFYTKIMVQCKNIDQNQDFYVAMQQLNSLEIDKLLKTLINL